MAYGFLRRFGQIFLESNEIWQFRLTADGIVRCFGQIILESDASSLWLRQPSDGTAESLVSHFGQILGINLTNTADESVSH